MAGAATLGYKPTFRSLQCAYNGAFVGPPRVKIPVPALTATVTSTVQGLSQPKPSPSPADTGTPSMPPPTSWQDQAIIHNLRHLLRPRSSRGVLPTALAVQTTPAALVMLALQMILEVQTTPVVRESQEAPAILETPTLEVLIVLIVQITQ